MAQQSIRSKKTLKLSAAIVVAASTLSACQTLSLPQIDEGIGYREARFVEISAMREWRQCRDDALVLDEQARTRSSPAKYLASAEQLTQCETQVGPDAANVARDERMRAYAVSIQNYLKGGDVAKARENLEKFKTHFSEDDLYFADGSSYIQSLEILLGLKDRTAVGELSMANVSAELKAELRRARYWQRH